MIPPRMPSDAVARAWPASRADWRHWLAPGLLLAVTLAVGWLCWPTTRSLFEEWFVTPSSAYRHGPLVLLVSLWLAMRALRDQALPAAPEPGAWAWLLLLAACSLGWLLAHRAGIQVAHQALLPAILWLALRVVLGRRIAVAVLVPIGLLYSAIPLWHVAVPALQAMTVAVAGALLRVAGITAYVVGDYVHIRSGVFYVEDGCAGLHYFIVAATIAALYGEVRGDRWRTRIALLAFAVALALVSNWLRVFIIIVAGDLTDMQHYLVRIDHATFGWVVFAVAMAVFLLATRSRAPGESPAPPMAENPAGPTSLRAVGVATGVASAMAALGPAWMMLGPVRPAAAPNLSLADPIAGWSGPTESCHGRWHPEFAGADRQLIREYARDTSRVCVYLANYSSQHQGKEMIGYGNSIHSAGSEIVSFGVRQAAGRRVTELRLGDELRADRLIWYSYAVGDREMTRGIEAQWWYALGTLWGAPASGVYAISTICEPDCGAARRLLEEFLPNVGVGDARG